MLTGPFLDRSWMGQNPDYNSSEIVMLGLPFDGTVSYRSGSSLRLSKFVWQAGGWKNILHVLTDILKMLISMMRAIWNFLSVIHIRVFVGQAVPDKNTICLKLT